jgi:hypothetical protein
VGGDRTPGGCIACTTARPNRDRGSRLAGAHSTTGDRRTDRKIEQAIKEIEDSLDPQLWLDDSHLTDKGKKVFHEEREAANKLTQIKDPPAEVASVLDAFVVADQALARTAIDEAIAAGGDPRKLTDAERQMAKGLGGDREWSFGSGDHALRARLE